MNKWMTYNIHQNIERQLSFYGILWRLLAMVQWVNICPHFEHEHPCPCCMLLSKCICIQNVCKSEKPTLACQINTISIPSCSLSKNYVFLYINHKPTMPNFIIWHQSFLLRVITQVLIFEIEWWHFLLKKELILILISTHHAF